MEGNYIILYLILFPIIAAIVRVWFGKKDKFLKTLITDFTVVIEFIMLVILMLQVNPNTLFWFKLDNISAKGLSFAFDGFRGIQALLTAFVWLITTIYSKQYLKELQDRDRYETITLLTLGATLGVFLSADLFTTFIFFELMTLTSYIWIVGEETENCLHASKSYLTIGILGGLVTLMGLFLLYASIGTLEINGLFQACKNYENKTELYIAGALILFGFAAKAGMVPLHTWLPKCYVAASAPVSAVFSTILSKTGIFGILVVSSRIFLYEPEFGIAMLLFGMATMIVGGVLAMLSIDLKRILACSSMSQIGFLLVGIGMQTMLGQQNEIAVKGTILHMVNHTLIKLVLFLVAGIIFLDTKSYDLNVIRGYGKNKPILKYSFLMGGLGIAGIPFWNGYISKTLLHESIVQYIDFIGIQNEMFLFFQIVEWTFLLSGGLTIAYMLKAFIAVFVYEPIKEVDTEKTKELQEINRENKAMFLFCASILPIMGLFPHLFLDKIGQLSFGFFQISQLEEMTSYFSSSNLKGAMISILIGIVLYLFIVKGCFIQKVKGEERYIDCLPIWLDLEERVYRPFLFQLLPFIFAFFSRVCETALDSFISLLRYTLFHKRKEKARMIGTRTTYVVGTIVDDIVFCLNKTIFRKRPIKKSFVFLLAKGQKEMEHTNRLISRTVSFGLLMFCIGLYLTLSYLLFL